MLEVVAQGVEAVLGLLGVAVAKNDGSRYGVEDGVVLDLHGAI
jgi:hypothetical protein